MANVAFTLLPILAFAAILLLVAREDALTMLIRNRFCLAIAGLYPAYVLTAPTPVEWVHASILAGIVLVGGFALYARGLMGGGDAKLFAACSLWAGTTHFADLLLVTGLAGAALAILMLARARWVRAQAERTGTGAFVQRSAFAADLPYGVAIAAGGLQVAIRLLIGG